MQGVSTACVLTCCVRAVTVQPGKHGAITAVARAALRSKVPASALPAALGLPAPAQSCAHSDLMQFWAAGPPPLLLDMQDLPAIMGKVRACCLHYNSRPPHPSTLVASQEYQNAGPTRCWSRDGWLCLGVSECFLGVFVLLK